MALGRHLRNLSSLLRSTLVLSPAVRQDCFRLCEPYRGTSHVYSVSQGAFLKPDVASDETESLQYIKDQKKITLDVFSNVNHQIENRSHGRLFAIIHVAGKQFKVTAEDLLVIEGYWPPNIGDKLQLKKILLVGGSDFTLIGRPLLPHGLASVDATVIEKTMSHTKAIFRKRRRKQYMRINFHRSEYTILRINSIELSENVNVKKEVEGLETIF